MDESLIPLLKAYQGEVPGGPEGERIMRGRARTAILEDVSLDDVLRPRLSIKEMNDLLEYMGWMTWDVVGMRSTEGESGLIPRQEYESLAFIQEFYRFPQLYEALTRRVGAEGLVEMGRAARREIGTKVDMVHNICTGLCPLMGRGILVRMGWLRTEESILAINTFLQFMRRVCWGYRGDGSVFTSQKAHTNFVLERDWLDRFARELEPLDREGNRQSFSRLNSSTELLSFLLHFDCRLGMNDIGPYDLGGGQLMIVRNLFLREDIYHWSDVCEGLPYALTLAFVLDAQAMGLQEIKVVNGATTFTRPGNYLPYVTHACCYLRREWDSPMEEIERLPLVEAKNLARQAQEITFKLYKKIARMSRRQLITNGLYVYYIDMILPYARLAGMYDELCREYDLWELAEETSRAYYALLEGNFAQEAVPAIMISGEGFPFIPELCYW